MCFLLPPDKYHIVFVNASIDHGFPVSVQNVHFVIIDKAGWNREKAFQVLFRVIRDSAGDEANNPHLPGFRFAELESLGSEEQYVVTVHG